MVFASDALLRTLADVQARTRKCVVLYSGGIDSSYFLIWAARQEIDVTALNVDLMGGGAPPPDQEEFVRQLGLTYRSIDATEDFTGHYVSAGIRADCRYDGIFPISSSLSRPLMARLAVGVAREIGADTIVHTAAAHQNSCARYNNAIRALAPELLIGNPFLEDDIPRPDKLAAVSTHHPVQTGIYSIDENIWARVIENGSLDSVANAVPEEIFAWCKSPRNAPAEAVTTAIGFECGVPVALDGSRRTLRAILDELNIRAGEFGIGRFNGMEDTRLGVKNHEVREAPAAAVVLAARKHLEQFVLTAEELRLKSVIDNEWTHLVAKGGWYSDLKAAMDEFIMRLSRPVTGLVELEISPGSAFVRSVSAEGGLGMDTPTSERLLSEPMSLAVETQHALSRGMLG